MIGCFRMTNSVGVYGEEPRFATPISIDSVSIRACLQCLSPRTEFFAARTTLFAYAL